MLKSLKKSKTKAKKRGSHVRCRSVGVAFVSFYLGQTATFSQGNRMGKFFGKAHLHFLFFPFVFEKKEIVWGSSDCSIIYFL